MKVDLTPIRPIEKYAWLVTQGRLQRHRSVQSLNFCGRCHPASNPMSTLEPPAPDTSLDELAQLELKIAQRADELTRLDEGRHGDRNFWQDAEHEIWEFRLRSLKFTPAR